MAQNRSARLITKRTTVPGKIPTGTTGNEGNLIQAGELASNLPDRKLWGYDGTGVFEYGSNSFLGLTGGTITGDTRIIGSFSADTLFSGSTDVETIIRNLLSSDSHTFVQPGTNIITGGTPQLPIINTVDSPSFNELTTSGNTTLAATTAISFSASSISGDTLFSGDTNLNEIFQTANSSPYRSEIFTAGTTYDFTGTTNLVSINKATGSSTFVNLPSSPIVNDFYIVKDRKGDSNINPITVSGGTYNIDGNSSVQIKKKNNPSFTFLFDGEEYIII